MPESLAFSPDQLQDMEEDAPDDANSAKTDALIKQVEQLSESVNHITELLDRHFKPDDPFHSQNEYEEEDEEG